MGEDVTDGETVSNTIYIKELRIPCIIGARSEERLKKQDVFISVELMCSHLKARYTDKLEDTLDYSLLSKRIVEMVESSDYQLIEALGEAVCVKCFEDANVREVVVRVEKPGAIPAAKTVGVEIRKQREK